MSTGTNLAALHGVTSKPTPILVVDDDAEWRETLSAFLASEGHLVATAENGAEALALLSSLRACVVITDLQMPIMDGQHLLAAVEARREPFPVIVMTADGAHARRLGLSRAFRVMEKSASLETLLATVIEASASQRREGVRRLGSWKAATKVLFVTAIAVSSVALINHLRLTLLTSA